MITSRLISKGRHHAGKYLAAFLKQADKPLRAVGHDVNHCSLLQHVIFLANRRLILIILKGLKVLNGSQNER